MKSLLISSILCTIIFSFGCNSKPVAVEFAEVCKLENDGKYVETTGYLDNVGDLNCSGKQGENMTCNLMIKKGRKY